MTLTTQHEAPTPTCSKTSNHFHFEGFLDWSPLEQFCLILSNRAETPYLSPGDFMHMGYVCRPGLPGIWQYKHVDTRMFINIDKSGHSYSVFRYHWDGPLQVVSHRSVADTLDRLDLELLAEIRKTETHVT